MARSSTATPPTSSAARSRACSPACEARRPATFGSGSAATCGSRRPRWLAGSATGLVAEGCAVLDAGMVATEMLYELVGSRELDGGAMVTASHNPKAYTGIKLVREGALALSGDAGIGDVRAAIEAGLPDPPGGGTVEAVDVYDDFHHRVAGVHRPGPGQAAARRRRRRQRDGRADGRPAARAPRPRSGDHLLGPRRRVPRPRAEPAAGREPPVHHRQGARGGGEPGDRLGRRRRPLLLHRRPRRVRGRRLPDRAPGPAAPRARSRARRSSTTCAPAARSPTRCASSAAPRT